MLMGLLRQLTDDLISYLDRRAVAHDHPGLFLQGTQLIVQSIIFQIAHDLCIFHIIFLCSIIELLYKLFNSCYLDIVVIPAFVLIFLNIYSVTLIIIFIIILIIFFHTHPGRSCLKNSYIHSFYPNIKHSILIYIYLYTLEYLY